MLKSLFESSIDKLHIPADMKDAIKQINNICLEAEGDEKDLGYTPVPKEDIEKAKKQMVNDKYKYEAYPKAEQSNAAQKDEGKDEKENTDVGNAKSEQANTQPTEQQQTQAATRGEQPAQNAETKTAEQPAQNAEGQQSQAADGKAAKQPAAQPAKPQYRRGADVATVQYFLQSALPNSNIVADGILGPKTITAIQQKEDIDTTGKMDENTQNAFNQLLAEAKKKVIPLQEKLGVTADGLIGKQTLQAMAKQNMHVANVFSKDVKNANTPARNTNVATKKADVDLLDTPFNAAQAEKDLASNQITKAEYNTWKGFGISPEHQRKNPKETKSECIRLAHYTPAERQQIIQERLAKNNPKTGKTKPSVGAGNNKNVAEVAANVKGPQNDAENKFFKQTKENWTKVYTEKFKNNPERIEPAAEQQARIELMKYRARMAQAARQNAQQQPQQQVAANGNTTPAQKAAPKQKQQKQGTQSYSGKVSYIHLPPDEKKVYDEAEKKYLDENMKWGKNEQIALDQAALAASTAVLKYRAQKGGNQKG